MLVVARSNSSLWSHMDEVDRTAITLIQVNYAFMFFYNMITAAAGRLSDEVEVLQAFGGPARH
jgi:hypothetical protein